MPIKKKIIQVPFEHIIADEDFNGRKDYTEIPELAKSIYKDGLMQPLGIAIRSLSEGDRYFLVYGFRRYKALQMLRAEYGEEYYSTLEVVVNEGTLDELRIRNLGENLLRKSLSHYEISQQIKSMVLAGMDQQDIGNRLGRPQSWVSLYHKAATKLNPSALNAFKTGELTLEQAVTLADVSEEKQKEVLTQMGDADSKAEAKQLLRNAANESGKKRKYTKRARLSSKDMIELISQVSFQAESPAYTDEEQIFYNGLAAGLRAARGDAAVDVKNLDYKTKYSDPDYHKNAKKLDSGEDPDTSTATAEEAGEDEEETDTEPAKGDEEAEDKPYNLYELPTSTPEEDARAAAESRRMDAALAEADAEAAEAEAEEAKYETSKAIEPEGIKGLDIPPKRKRGRPRKNPETNARQS